MSAQPNTLSDQIKSLLSTTDDVTRLSDALDLLQNELYKTDSRKPLEKLDACIPHTFADVIKNSFTDNPPQTPQDMKSILSSLKETLENLTTVSLTLAVDPPQNTIETLSEWIKTTYGNNAVMEFSINPHILGGAIIVNQGMYIDLSLKKKLNNLFENKKDEIAAMLK